MDAAGSAEWRVRVQPDARLRIVNKIVETLQEQLPVFRGQNLGDLRSIAVRFEEKMFASAKNQMDYLGKISLKMLTVEAKTRHIVFASKTASTLSDLSHSSPGGPGPDWQEEIYQKHESPAPPWLPSGRLESMKKMMHQEDRLVELLRLPRSSIRPHLQEESPHYEKQILHFNDSEGRTIAGGGVNSLPNMSVDFRPGNGAPVNQRGTSR